MKILLIVTIFNSLTSKVFCKLKDLGHIVSVKYALNNQKMIEEIELFKPDLIISPFLKKILPSQIWKNTPTIIIHPGIVGDRGGSAIDWAVLKDLDTWGVTALQANAVVDGGDIWASREFTMPKRSKAFIYRNLVSEATLEIVDEILEKFIDKNFKPTPLNYRDANVKGEPHNLITQKDLKLNWEKDTTEDIIRKINAGDSLPGVLDNFLGVDCHLFGAWNEGELRGKPKEILAKRYNAVCVGTIDGALWISHLKEAGQRRIKLPATYVLKDRLQGVIESRVPIYFDSFKETFREIVFIKEEDIGYLYFNFHNGAMDGEQCIRLKYAFLAAKQEVDVVVLMGADDFFSNGIHLNIMEDSKKSDEDGWSNINAMNDLVRTILMEDDVVTVCAFNANAGAGGVFLGLACDKVFIKNGVILNPHYKTIGLHGSEYWTYSLPKRVGQELAEKLTEDALPISAHYSKKIGVVDEIYKNENDLKKLCQNLRESDEYYDILDLKEELEIEELDKFRDKELEKMYPSFYEKDSEFNKLRSEFVYKVCPIMTPSRLKYNNEVVK